MITKQSVLDIFPGFSTTFEGCLPFMYLDVIGLVTTGIGNLIDPVDAAMGLPWTSANGDRATRSEIASCWHLVKAQKLLAKGGGVAFGRLPWNDLRLSTDAIAALVAARMNQNEEAIIQRYPHFVEWPADAQLGLHSMAWAMGPWFHFPVFTAAVNELPPDFDTAAWQCKISNGAPARNDANHHLFMNAAYVLDRGLDPEVLMWPEVPPPPSTEPAPTETA